MPPPAEFDQSDTAGAPPPQARQLPDTLPADPLPLFQAWFDEAVARRVQPNPDAMMLATIDPDGRPSARMMLCKKIDIQHGFVVFYTNRKGRKAEALQANPRAAAVMHWDGLERQVRLEGPVVQSPDDESDEYFASRPWPSRIGAWASDQSRPLASREEMVARIMDSMLRFGLEPANPPPEQAPVEIPRPPHWGGYRLFIERIELWVAGAGRLHDRAVWARRLEQTGPDLFIAGDWEAGQRLQP
jgi:pyridoxamine 5'-phosphate oxidase